MGNGTTKTGHGGAAGSPPPEAALHTEVGPQLTANILPTITGDPELPHNKDWGILVLPDTSHVGRTVTLSL